MNDFDLFFLFRRSLAVVCAIYASARLTQTVWSWHRFLSPARRSTNLARHYLILHVLRLRVHRFTLELVQIVALVALFFYIVSLHQSLG